MLLPLGNPWLYRSVFSAHAAPACSSGIITVYPSILPEKSGSLQHRRPWRHELGHDKRSLGGAPRLFLHAVYVPLQVKIKRAKDVARFLKRFRYVFTLYWYSVISKVRYRYLKKNQSAPGPSEHPPVMGGKMSNFRWDQRLQI